MFKKRKNRCYVLDESTKQPGLIHGFSTREFGNLKVRRSLNSNKNLNKFLKVLKIKQNNLIMMEQVHGNKVRLIGKRDRGKVIKGVDGLISNQKGLFLGVNTADCLPLFFYDPKKKNVGIAHAGWKGVLLGIAKKMAKEMQKMGSKPEEIMVGIGPYIKNCCYIIGKDLLERFEKEFGRMAGMVYQKDGKIYLDLAMPIRPQLIKAGIKNGNIEVAEACTCCQKEDFFSYRREGNKNTYGEMLGVVGWT